MTFEAVKCEVNTEPNVTTKQNQITKSKICGLWSLSKQFYFFRLCVPALQLRLFYIHRGLKQVNNKHIHNFRLIIAKTHKDRMKDETKVIESVKSAKKKFFCRIVRNENGAPNDLKCAISSFTIEIVVSLYYFLIQFYNI